MNLPDRLSYNHTNPVFYDNDWCNDYVDWYLMALASAGDIQYKGISTSSSIAPYNKHVPIEELELQWEIRAKHVERGRNSGFRNLPNPVHGTKGNLVKPASGKIEDTRPIDSAGTRLIIQEAHKTNAKKPLVICMGGSLTVAADAFLLDPSIADKVIVAWLDNFNSGMTGYNGWADGWAAYIVLERLPLVQFTVESKGVANIPKARLLELPPCEAREYMIESTPDVAAPQGDADGPPAISLMCRDYIREFKSVSFGGWTHRDGHEMPLLKEDPNGRAVVVTKADGNIASQEWFRALKNPATWTHAPVMA